MFAESNMTAFDEGMHDLVSESLCAREKEKAANGWSTC